MKWLRNIIGVAAIVAASGWIASAIVALQWNVSSNLELRTNRSGIGITWLLHTRAPCPTPRFSAEGASGPWFGMPRRGYLLRWRVGDASPTHFNFIPHWLTNLIAWSLFIVLWRKARKHPKGHYQSCGYDLTGNVSGRYPECDARRCEPV